MLTLLLTDGTPGLQIQQGEVWIDVEAVPGGLVVNLGDMLERYESDSAVTFSFWLFMSYKSRDWPGHSLAETTVWESLNMSSRECCYCWLR